MRDTTKSVIVTLTAAVLAAAAVLVLAPFLARHWPADWDELADIGQLLGTALSTSALVILAGSFLYQAREQHYTNKFNLLSEARELNSLILADPELFGPVLSASGSGDPRRFVATDMIFRMLATGYGTGTVTERNLRLSPQVREFLHAPATDEYWQRMRENWATNTNHRSDDRFARIMAELREQAPHPVPGPPDPSIRRAAGRGAPPHGRPCAYRASPGHAASCE